MDACAEFSAVLAEAGIECPDDVIADGTLHRFKADGDRETNCWYVLYPDGVPSGAFGCWKRSISDTWCSKNGRGFTEAERAEGKRRMEDAKRQREAEETKRHAERPEPGGGYLEVRTGSARGPSVPGEKGR